MRALLRSPFHGIASANLCIVLYTGRRSGRRFETPLSYVRDGGRVLLLSSVDTGWWTNFLPPKGDPAWTGEAVEILAAGDILRGRARTIQHDREHLHASARHFLTALPGTRSSTASGSTASGDRRTRSSPAPSTGSSWSRSTSRAERSGPSRRRQIWPFFGAGVAASASRWAVQASSSIVGSAPGVGAGTTRRGSARCSRSRP
jgi:hypothetical protein